MKKIVLSASVIAIFIAYVLHQANEGNGSIGERVVVPQGTLNAPNSPIPSPSSGNSKTTISTGVYKDGTYIGSNADAFYGNVQVKVVISGGNITNVIFLDHPHDKQTSREINAQAMPFLTQEAIQAQSANVDVVTGATQTSHAFIESLKSALSQAS